VPLPGQTGPERGAVSTHDDVSSSDADAQLWRLTREVANLLDSLPWVLVGGQMVAIPSLPESGETPSLL